MQEYEPSSTLAYLERSTGLLTSPHRMAEPIPARRSANVSLAFLETMLDGATDGFIVLDANGRVRFAGGQAEMLLGVEITPGELLVSNLPPERQDEFESIMRAVSEDGLERLLELWCASDPLQRVRVRLASIEEAVVATVSPAPLRKELARDFTTLANSIPQLAWMANADGWISWYNQRWYDYTGTTLEEMEGWGWQAVHHPAEVGRVTRRFREAVETGEPWEDTFPLRGRDGEYRWFLSRALPIRDSSGRIVRWFGTNTDITDQREMELALRESESKHRALANRLQAVLDVLPVGVVIADRDGRLEMTNDVARSIWGGESPQLYRDETGRVRTRRAQDEAALDPQEWAMARALNGESVEGGEEVELLCPNGTRRTLLNYALPIVTDGELDGGIAVSVDITKLRETERELRELNETLERRVAERTETLERRNQELQSFAYLASHDLREPLRKIQTFAGLIVTDYGESLEEEARIFLQKLQDASGRMMQLLDDLLSYSRVATEQHSFVTLEVRSVVNDVLVDLELALAHCCVAVELEPDLSLDADPTKFRQLLNHLLMNAAKFTRKGVEPQIRLSGHADESDTRHCRIVVEDNGIGFESRFAERIFQPFERLHGRSEYEGTGMGLAICRRIVDRHGGEIVAQGAPGTGSRFVVRLPITHIEEGTPV